MWKTKYEYQPFNQDKIIKYTNDLLDDACKMIAERLQSELPQIPKSMEAAGMRLVLLPDFDNFERYSKTWVCRFYPTILKKYIYICRNHLSLI